MLPLPKSSDLSYADRKPTVSFGFIPEISPANYFRLPLILPSIIDYIY
jgi:hypothetical protein